jgi:hypothetical protein
MKKKEREEDEEEEKGKKKHANLDRQSVLSDSLAAFPLSSW